MISNPDSALDTLAREELGIDPASLGGSAWAAAGASYGLFTLGAIAIMLLLVYRSIVTTVIQLFMTFIALLSSRGVIALLEQNCTSCMLCARECPDWCITIDSHKEVIPAKEPGARDRTKNSLDRFAIDFSLCMYCGICIEVCPFDALFWSPEFAYAEFDIRNLTHEKDRLGAWMATVPPPPALDPRAEEPKEIAAAAKAIAKASPVEGQE